MKRHMALVLLFLLSLPLSALAMSHDHGGHGGQAMDHGAMAMDHGNMIMVGDDVEDGVKASAHLKDVAAAMKKAGQPFTHHFMVIFADQQTGQAITEGTAALKVTGPDGKTAEAIKLIGMEGHFGADVVLPQKGEYTFEVGTKLPDGKKRTFQFKQSLK